MPYDDADSGDEEANSEQDSAELTTFDELIPSEEEEQAAISQVSFEWCATVREAGERYRDGEWIPVIAVECGVPMEKAQRAVKTYYLLMREPPLAGVRSIVFDNGRRYFADGARLEELDAETRVEAEEHVQAFVGRTLLDNELDDVDIERPVPSMEVPSVRTPTSLQEIPSMEAMESLNRSMTAATAALSGANLIDERVMSQAAEGLQQAVDAFSTSKVQAMQQAVRGSNLGKIGVTAGLASSAAVSSAVASSALAGVEPSILQAASQPAVQGVMEATQVMQQLNTPVMVRAMNAVNQSAVHQVMQEMQSLPMLQMTDLLEEYRLQMVAPVLEELDSLQYGLTGMGAMGAVAARPAVGQQSTHEEVTWSPVQSKSVPAVDDTGSRWWLVERVHERSSDILLVLVTESAGVTIAYLSQMYPHHQPIIAYAGHSVGALLQIALLLVLTDD